MTCVSCSEPEAEHVSQHELHTWRAGMTMSVRTTVGSVQYMIVLLCTALSRSGSRNKDCAMGQYCTTP